MDCLTGFVGSKATINSRKWGKLTLESASFTPAVDGDLVVHIGHPFEEPAPLVRIHSECTFAQVFDSDLCDCADQFQIAMARLVQEGNGLLFYLRFDGRGAGLAAKTKATDLEVNGMDTYESRVCIGVLPESRDFTKIGEYLRKNGVSKVRLMTNNPLKAKNVEDLGIQVERIPLVIENPNENVRFLYETKRNRFQHDLPDSE